MKAFLEKNKIPIAIITAALIIAAAIWLSKRSPSAGSENAQSAQPVRPASTRIKFADAPDYIGTTVCVTGKVNHVSTSEKGTIFINFCADYKSCPFGAVIFESVASKFPNPDQYTGKNVEITGFITTYQGRPEIVLDNPDQIKIAK
jgi:DNA/RNA endonuclease YhcR with UshA esterase domain